MFKSIFNKFTSNTQKLDLSSLSFMKSPSASLILDKDGVILEANHSFSDLMGYTIKELKGGKVSLLKSGKHDNIFYKNLWSVFLKSDRHNFEIHNKHKDGTILLIKEKVVKTTKNGVEFFFVTYDDITQSRKLQSRQQHLATHDMLTGLANRTLLHDRYSQAILNAKRNHKKLAIFLCDLNSFKEVNDTYGHNFGDVVLQKISKNLQSLVRDTDTVARYGGDEFVIIVEHLHNNDEMMEIYQQIKSKSAIDVENDNGKCHMSMSIGHACFPTDGLQFDQLINMADTRMYDIKKEYYGY